MVRACFSPGQIVCYSINLQILTAGLVIVSVDFFFFGQYSELKRKKK